MPAFFAYDIQIDPEGDEDYDAIVIASTEEKARDLVSAHLNMCPDEVGLQRLKHPERAANYAGRMRVPLIQEEKEM